MKKSLINTIAALSLAAGMGLGFAGSANAQGVKGYESITDVVPTTQQVVSYRGSNLGPIESGAVSYAIEDNHETFKLADGKLLVNKKLGYALFEGNDGTQLIGKVCKDYKSGSDPTQCAPAGDINAINNAIAKNKGIVYRDLAVFALLAGAAGYAVNTAASSAPAAPVGGGSGTF